MKGFRLLLGALCALVLAACGQGSVKSPDFTSALKSITVSPASGSVGNGETLQFTATGVYTAQPGKADETRDITAEVEWTSSDPAVATIDAVTGLATGVGKGTTTITATKGKIKQTALLTGEGLVLRELVITPKTGVTAPKGKVTYVAQGRFSDSATPRDLSAADVINWSIDSAIGTISPNSGKTVVVTAGTTEGLATITATVLNPADPTTDGKSATATFVVGVVTGVRIEPSTASKPVGIPQEFKAIASFQTSTGGGVIPDQEVPAVWTASTAADKQPTLDSACDSSADASSTCLVTGRAVGTVTVTAVYNDGVNPTFSPTAVLTVTDPILVKVAIEAVDPNVVILPGTPTDATRRANIPLGSGPSFQARYSYSDEENTLLPRSTDEAVDWSLSDTSGNIATLSVDPITNIATVTTKAKTPANSPVVLTATATPTIKDSLKLNIGDAALTELLGLRPTKAYVAVTRSQEFVAVGKFSNGATADVPDSAVDWTSDASTVATVNANGVATAVGAAGTSTKINAALKSAPASKVSADFIVTSTRCTIPVLATDGATAIPGPNAGVSLLAGTRDEPFIIDQLPLTFGQINLGVGLINGFRSIDINFGDSAPYSPAEIGSKPAFIVGQPTGALVLANLLAQLEIQTLSDGAVVETSGDLIPLRVDLLGTTIIDVNNSQDQVLVAIDSSLPFNGIRLKLKSGTATALQSINVFAACANSDPVTPTLNGIGSIYTIPELPTRTTQVGQGVTFRAKTLVGADIPPPDVTWTSSNTAVLPNPNALGNAVPLSAGVTTVTATLKDQSQCTTNCSATYSLTVVQNYCNTPFNTANATVSRTIQGLCVLCSTSDLPNILDNSDLTTAKVYVPVGLLNAGVNVRVTSKTPTPFPAGQNVGFLVAQPTGPLVVAEVLSQLEVSTYLDGVKAESFTYVDGLDLDLLGLNVDGGLTFGIVRIPTPTTQPFNAVQLGYKSGVATALTALQIGSACANVGPDFLGGSLPPVVVP